MKKERPFYVLVTEIQRTNRIIYKVMRARLHVQCCYVVCILGPRGEYFPDYLEEPAPPIVWTQVNCLLTLICLLFVETARDGHLLFGGFEFI